MNIDLLYSLLTNDAKKELLKLLIMDDSLNTEPQNNVEYVAPPKDDILLDDWIAIMLHRGLISSMRLYNSIKDATRKNGRWNGKYLGEIEEHHLLSLRNVWKKSWEEFLQLRNNYYQDLKK